MWEMTLKSLTELTDTWERGGSPDECYKVGGGPEEDEYYRKRRKKKRKQSLSKTDRKDNYFGPLPRNNKIAWHRTYKPVAKDERR